MQEEQTVSFQATDFGSHVPWFVSLFGFYLLIVLVMTVLRAVRVIRSLRQQRKAQKLETSTDFTPFDPRSNIHLIKNLSHLTLLLAVLVLSWSMTNIFAGVSAVKAPDLASTAARLAQALVPFTMGIIFCTSQFCCAMFLRSLVRRTNSTIRRRLRAGNLPDSDQDAIRDLRS